MKKMKLICFVAMALIGAQSYAQKITVLEGSLKFLKGEKIVNVEYNWDNCSVGKFDKEQDYIDTKKREYNAKEAGRGDKWASNWVGDRKARFIPEFEKLFNKGTEKIGMYLGNEKKAKYTAIVSTTFIEPGFNVYVTKKNASIDLMITIVETDNHDNVVAKLVSKNNPGRTFGMSDMDTGIRISESYALAGKKLAAYLVGVFKK